MPAYALKLLVAMTEHNPIFTRYRTSHLLVLFFLYKMWRIEILEDWHLSCQSRSCSCFLLTVPGISDSIVEFVSCEWVMLKTMTSLKGKNVNLYLCLYGTPGESQQY